MAQHVAIYVRVSTSQQNHKSQEPDLEQWASHQQESVKWYQDTFTGKTMERPGWLKLEDAIRTGKVSTVVVWRLDRLGRTAKGLTALFDEFQRKRINLVSLKDGVDLSTPAGRLIAHVLASVAQYESEVRGERVRAGQAVARAKGTKWGGSKPGDRKKVTPALAKAVRRMRDDGESVSSIARSLKLSRPTIYNVLNELRIGRDITK